jgi:hypothetical protein
MSNEIFLLLWVAILPIIAYMDMVVFRKAFKAEFGLEPKWTYWLVPTFMEMMMFFAGCGMMFFYLKVAA